MAPTGHIKLGLYNSLRPYVVDDIRNVARDGANPFAAPGGATQGYNDLEGWAEWTMRDWQAGGGRTDPEEGGFLFGTLDSRVPEQLTLPNRSWPLLPGGMSSANNYWWRDMVVNKTVPVGLGGTYLEYGIRFQNFTLAANFVTQNISASSCFAYFKAIGTMVTLNIYRATATTVGAQIGTLNLAADNYTEAPRWEEFRMSGSGVWAAAAPNDWVVVSITCPFNPIDVGVANAGGGYGSAIFNGTTWTLGAINTGVIPAIFPGAQCVTRNQDHYINILTEYHDTVYAASTSDDCVWKWNEPNYSWDFLVDVGSTVGGPTWAGNIANLYGGQSILTIYNSAGGTNIAYYNYATGLTQAYPLVPGGYKLHAHDDGYFWISNGVDVKYFSEGIWTTITGVADVYHPILAMACMNGDLYFATQRGLGRIAKGDYPVGVVGWSSYVGNTNVKMVSFQSSLFIVTNGKLYRMDQSHTLMQVRIPGNDMQVRIYGRDITALCAGNNWLYIATHGTTGGMVWVWTPEGVHPVSPQESMVLAMCYCRSLNALFMGGKARVWRMFLPDADVDPYYDDYARFEADGWLETDKFTSSNVLLKKDFESVYVDFDRRGGHETAMVYWQDEAVPGSWRLLGTLAAGSGELRWSNYGIRPNSRWIRLGVRLRKSADGVAGTYTPRIKAISVKYIPMINDRYRWRLNIIVPPRGMDTDDEMYTGTYTQAQQIAHLDQVIKSVAPVIFEDVDLVKYECKVTAHSRNVERWEAIRGGTSLATYIYSLTLEQVNSDIYVGP